VHLFTSDLYASSLTPDVKRLRRFEKISLKPGESKTLSFNLSADDLAYADRNGKMMVEAGEFEVEIGGLKKRFTLQGEPVAVH
jgi:beta-glucosidase